MSPTFKPYDAAPLTIGVTVPASIRDVEATDQAHTPERAPAAGVTPPTTAAGAPTPHMIAMHERIGEMLLNVEMAREHFAFPPRIGIPERAPAAGVTPPTTAAGALPYVLNDFGGVPLLEPEYSAPEGHASAEALASQRVEALLRGALLFLMDAQKAANMAHECLIRVPDDAPAVKRTNPLSVEVVRARNEVAGMIEKLWALGVKP